MVNPSQLAGMAQSAYSTGALTGLSIEPVRQAAKERRDYERKQQDSIYQITADLDAQAYNTLSNDVDQIFQDVADKKIYYDSPDMMGRLSALRGKAKAMSETDAILKAATDQFTKNPDGFVYNKKDANGNIVAGGYQDFVADLQARRNEKFEVPEEYMQSINGMLQNIGSRIDEQVVVPKMQKTLADLGDGFRKTKEALLKGGEPEEIKFGRSVIRVDSTTDITDFKKQITDAMVDSYSNDFSQLAALARANGYNGTNREFAEAFVNESLPMTQVTSEIRRDANPQTDTDKNSTNTRIFRSGSGWRNDVALFQKIGENEVKVNSLSTSDPTKAWVGEGLIDDEGDKGTKSTAASLVRQNGKIYIKLVGDATNPMKPRLVPFDKNSDLFFELYRLTAEDFDTIIRDEEVKDTTTPPTKIQVSERATGL